MQDCFKVILIAVLSLVVLSATGAAADADAMKGWGISDPYNTFYNAKELERFKATVVKIVEVVPMPGMSPGIALEVREGSEIILVHLGPVAFFKQADIGIKPGERVDVRGCWAEINGKDVLMASKVKKGENFELKVRLTKDGTPFWSMTPEQLAKEQKNQSN